MARKTLKEILAHFAHHLQHTHEQAAQATYNLGHADGMAEAEEKFKAGLGSAPPAVAPSGGESHAVETESGQEPHEEGEHAEA